MKKFNFKNLSPVKIGKAEDGSSTLIFYNPFSSVASDSSEVVKPAPYRTPTMNIDLDKELDSKIAVFTETKSKVEESSISINERIIDISKKRNELNDGMGQLPSDLPNEFQKAVNHMVESAKSTLSKTAQEISTDIDNSRNDANNTIFEIRKVLEQLGKKTNTYKILVDIPLIGLLFRKRHENLSGKLDNLLALSNDINKLFENLLYYKTQMSGY